ncbi:S-locus glycoprotein domain containing protein [Parasponia andersonii]|uniref:S-locus glycoprotein domain containing protein n=1 Tax=Parasponia andersonii TaxID=3476 RepID=A0A2P5CSJ2_PARAD|nr:S-locus glycoprotein domain containing protein [Parasponia andersonii]
MLKRLRLFISSKGVLKFMPKEKAKDYWETGWEEPRNGCDVYGVRGPFGICRISESPICECLDGFAPESYVEWSRGNWSEGCVRRTKLLCEKNFSNLDTNGGKNNGFRNIERMKLTDFYEYVEPAKSEDRCHRWCLNSCSCQASAYVNSIGCLVWSERLIDMECSSDEAALFLRLAHSELG